MDTKNVLVFLAGAAVAYFVIKQMDKKKMMATRPMPVPPVEVDPKLVACQASLAEALKTVRTTDIDGFKAQFMSDCMAATPVAEEMTTMEPIIDHAAPPVNTALDSELGLAV